jgi:hypothetical protein
MSNAPDHYTHADRKRLTPLRAKVRDYFLNAGWLDTRDAAKALGMERSTITSKLRDLVDRHHKHLGLKLERRNLGGGVHHYRLSYLEPGQIPLFNEPANPNNVKEENRHA